MRFVAAEAGFFARGLSEIEGGILPTCFVSKSGILWDTKRWIRKQALKEERVPKIEENSRARYGKSISENKA